MCLGALDWVWDRGTDERWSPIAPQVQTPRLQFPDTHLLWLAQVAPGPPQTRGQSLPAGHVVLSVQSGVERQKPLTELAKHVPPVHFPDRHWVPEVHDVPGQDAMQVWVVGLQLPLWQSAPEAQVPEPP